MKTIMVISFVYRNYINSWKKEEICSTSTVAPHPSPPPPIIMICYMGYLKYLKYPTYFAYSAYLPILAGERKSEDGRGGENVA